MGELGAKNVKREFCRGCSVCGMHIFVYLQKFGISVAWSGSREML